VAVKNVLIALGALPGYFVAAFAMDWLGRRRIQVIGFIGMIVLFLCLGCLLPQITARPVLFVLCYMATFFFANFGPNTVTFILPVEQYPASLRATGHGVSAATGKLGAFVGTSLFPLVQEKYGTAATFLACAAFSGLGLGLTLYCVHDLPGGLAARDLEYSNAVHGAVAVDNGLELSHASLLGLDISPGMSTGISEGLI
jgi:sugar phosphate permease